MSIYQTLEQLVAQAAVMLRPPERMTVSECAAKYRFLNNSGSFVGFWDNSVAPYLVEIMDELTSLEFTGLIFAGPARCGKSDLFFNYLLHTAMCDPADMMLLHMTQATSRDWSMGDLSRALRHSKALGNLLIPGAKNSNVHDKYFKSGMRLLIKHPSISELSGKTIPRLWLMDADRMPEDVEGEGLAFDLARKRAQTFKRFGMCVAESSPGYEVADPNWLAKSPHEAPPVKGILALYNRGDRRRWYWSCPQCDGKFEPDFELFDYPKLDTQDLLEMAEQVTLPCPHCGYPIKPELKRQLNIAGKWIKDGMIWREDGSVDGKPRRTDIASFHLKGPAAAFQDWSSLVLKFLQAKQEFENTGSEEALKSTTNTDQGMPYTPQASRLERLPEHLKARAKDWGGTADEPMVPVGTRFLVTTVDVQKSAFVYQVHGFGEGGDVWIVDSDRITRSETRFNDSGERELLDPASYLEDWDVLISQVIERTYPLADGSGRRMMMKAVGCDSGGRAGVTANAYNFWRKLRDRGDQSQIRFQLLKGEPSKTAPRIHVGYPDSQKKDRMAGARGDIPVLFINSNTMKDLTAARLGRETLGGGMVNFPHWMPDWLYSQLCSETRTEKGWFQIGSRRNEAWDLLVYAYAITLNGRQVSPNLEHINWESPPGWAKPWDDNDLVFGPEVTKRFASHEKSDISLANLGSALA